MVLDQPSPGQASFSPVLPTGRGSGSVAERGRGHLEGRPVGQWSMVGHSQLEAEQADDRADQPLRLAQRQAKHGPQRQRGQDRQGRVVRWPPGVVRGSARQAAIAASVNQTVRLPRCRKAASRRPSSSPYAAAWGYGDGERHGP